jgi:hypothetical protein
MKGVVVVVCAMVVAVVGIAAAVVGPVALGGAVTAGAGMESGKGENFTLQFAVTVKCVSTWRRGGGSDGGWGRGDM